ncbi:MAG: hypothetical protein H7Y88_06085 [Phycisphaerales bacterium]|nr:hypothetical protein [Phycisphaerales bacterium]
MTMTPEMKHLWDSIKTFRIDEPPPPVPATTGGEPAFPFAARLASENRWPRPHAERVITEYRRFLFLAVAAGHPVTPSKSVDEAWHLHLTYTRSYWDRLCGQVLRQPLHHEPTRGGAAEESKFADWYSRTLESYERFFGEPAPRDLWPHHSNLSRQESRPAPAHEPPPTRSRSPRTRWRRHAALAALGAPLLIITGCTRPLPNGVLWAMLIPALAIAAIGLAAIGISAALTRSGRTASARRSGESSGSCSGGAHGCGAGAATMHHGTGDHSGDGCDSGGCDGGSDGGGGTGGGDGGGGSGCGGGGGCGGS